MAVYCEHGYVPANCRICKIVALENQLKKLRPYLWHKPECRLFERRALAKEEDCFCGYFDILKVR